jgi:hypothetical protein
MKGPEFAAEAEWRLIHPGGGVVEGASKIGVEARGPILRTYFEIGFEPADLVSVIVGPVHAELNRPVVKRLLEEHGYVATTVETGKVALRTLQDR